MNERNQEGDENSGRRESFGLRDAALLLAAITLAVLAGLFVYWFLEKQKIQVTEGNDPVHIEWMFIDPGDADLVIEGRNVYEANCASCHGYGLEGQPDWRQRGPDGVLPAPPHDATGHTWHHPDAVLFATVKFGGQAFMPQGVKSGMPGYKDNLTDREIEAAIAYIKSRWPSKVRRQQGARNMQSRPVKQ